MITASPPPRLRDFSLGDTIRLVGIVRPLKIKQTRPCGMIDLHNASNYLSVTASLGHLVEIENERV